jgi:hypothetical protein
MSITYEEFLELPKGNPTKTLIVGKRYYIKNGVRKNIKMIDVFIGTFVKTVEHGKTVSFVFSDVEYLVKVGIAGVKTSVFAKSGWIYTEVISPTDEDHEKKKATHAELTEFINVKKSEPHSKTPPVSFFGEDFRKTRKSFNIRNAKSSYNGGKKKRTSKRRTLKKK